MFALELRIVHLLAEVDEFAEEIDTFLEMLEVEVCLTNLCDEVKNGLLAFERSHGIHFIKSILLQEHEVYDF